MSAKWQMKSNSILKSAALLLIISNLGNVFQYLIQIVLGRALSPVDFGIYNTVNSLFVVMMAFSVVISFVTARELIKLPQDTHVYTAFISDLLKKTAIVACLVFAMLSVFSAAIAEYFSLANPIPILLCAAIMAGLIVQAVFTGILQAMASYVTLSVMQAVQNGARLLFIALIVGVLNYSYNGALLGVFFSYLIVVMYYFYHLRASLDFRPGGAPVPGGMYGRMFQGAVPMALMWAYMGIVSNIDIPIVKHFSTEYDAGIYASGAVLGRIAWFLPSMLVFVLFPEVVRSDTRGESSVWSTLVIAVTTFVISFGIAAVFSIYPELILTIFMGARYVPAKETLMIVSFSMAIVAILSVLYNYCLAKRLTFFLYPAYIILSACLVLIYVTYHAKPNEVATVFLVGLAVTLVVNAGQFIVKYRVEIAHHFERLRREKKSFWSAE